MNGSGPPTRGEHTALEIFFFLLNFSGFRSSRIQRAKVTQKFGSSTAKIEVTRGQPKNRGDNQAGRSDFVDVPELAEWNHLTISGELRDQVKAELFVRYAKCFGNEQLYGNKRIKFWKGPAQVFR